MGRQMELQKIMNAFTAECKALFGDKLHNVLLFGSCARGEYNGDSDIDVMVILKMDDTEARRQLGIICEIAYEIDAKYDVLLSPVVQSENNFNKYGKLPGFHNNVMREGVSMIV